MRQGFRVRVGGGGGIGILDGKDGSPVVDVGLPNVATAVLSKVKGFAGGTAKSLLNTHWRNDHTGGNVKFGKADALITAHVNTLQRVSTDQHISVFQVRCSGTSGGGLPKKTFTGKEKMGFGGERMHLEHLPPGHADGDMLIHFETVSER